MDIPSIMNKLREKRPVFHSEADFQFAFAWEIQQHYPKASVRLEYPPTCDPTKYIDIVVRLGEDVFPIELKYKTKIFKAAVSGEQFSLKDQGAQDIGKYDLVKDICRLETFLNHMRGYKEGYAIWLTNDPSYWNVPKNNGTGYSAFSVHRGAIKEGTMTWGPSMNEGSIKTREKPLTLSGRYEIDWRDYSNLDAKNGVFMYALTVISLLDTPLYTL